MSEFFGSNTSFHQYGERNEAEDADPVLATQVPADPASVYLSDPPKSYTYYHAGPLFTLSELDLEQRDTTPHSIRDEDIKALLTCDMALFTYDGTELDSGTVVEYMVSKFADVPAVILRTDFRGAGDQGEHKGDPWNLMSSSWPRTVGVVAPSMAEYKAGLSTALTSQKPLSGEDLAKISESAADALVEATALKVVEAFDEVLSKPAKLPKELRESVYSWLALMPGFKAGDDKANVNGMLHLLNSKERKGLL